LLNKFSEALSEFGKLEMEPKLEGKRMTIILAPAPSKK
jgi:translation initiation factor IF-3